MSLRQSCDLLLTGARVVPVTPPGAVIWPGSVAVVGGRLLAVGPSAEIDARFAATRRIDCRGDVVMPGFVDAHVHAGMSLLKAYPCDFPLDRRLREMVWPFMAAVDEPATFAAVRAACLEFLAAGITTFADMFPHVEATASAVEQSGLRARIAPNLQSEASELDRSIARLMKRSSDRVHPAVGVQSTYGAAAEVLDSAAHLAADAGFPIHIHVAETRRDVEEGHDVARLAATGLMPPGSILAHAVHVAPPEIAMIRDAGAGVAHNPSANAKLGAGIALAGRYRQAGIPVGLGTDSVAANDRHDMFEEMRLAVFLSRLRADAAPALTAWDAIEMATLGGAVVLGLGEEIGSLEPGKQADLIRITLDAPHFAPLLADDAAQLAAHLVFAARKADVVTVMMAGDVLLEDGAAVAMDVGEVQAAARDAAARVLLRAGLA